MLRIRTADPTAPKQVGLVRTSVDAAGLVEHLAARPAPEQLVAGGLDIRDDQVESLGGAGCCRGDVLSEDDGAPGPRWRELHHAKVLTGGEVSVEPPPELRVELLGALNIRYRDDDHLEFHVESRDAGAASRVLPYQFHLFDLPCSSSYTFS